MPSKGRSANLSGGPYYRKGNASASVNPSASWSEDAAVRWNVSANARTIVADNLTLSASTNISPGSATNSSADLQYDASALLGEGTPKGKLILGAGVTFSPPNFTVMGRVRSALTSNLSVGASVGYTPATSDVIYAADASGKVGPLSVSANASLSTPDLPLTRL